MGLMMQTNIIQFVSRWCFSFNSKSRQLRLANRNTTTRVCHSSTARKRLATLCPVPDPRCGAMQKTNKRKERINERFIHVSPAVGTFGQRREASLILACRRLMYKTRCDINHCQCARDVNHCRLARRSVSSCCLEQQRCYFLTAYTCYSRSPLAVCFQG
jgi:hypothetical protein